MEAPEIPTLHAEARHSAAGSAEVLDTSAATATGDPAPAVVRRTLHGHEIAYRTAGSGPVLLLVHGMAGSSATWRHVISALAERYTVVAPDLLGHGESAKPRGDYSLGAHASLLRDLLNALGHERATCIGQSLGGGIVLQFAYQFPERCERIVLVGSGGLGNEVNPLLRALTAPFAETWLVKHRSPGVGILR